MVPFSFDSIGLSLGFGVFRFEKVSLLVLLRCSGAAGAAADVRAAASAAAHVITSAVLLSSDPSDLGSLL